MGWAGGYQIFDDVAAIVIKQKIDEKVKSKIIKAIFESLVENDWDTERDSALIRNRHPAVVKALSQYDWLFSDD